jgi:hypothetical protein
LSAFKYSKKVTIFFLHIKFIKYIIDEKQVQQSEITNRLTEIKSLFEETIPQAITNKEKSQITQKQTQEKRAVIQIKLLKLN